MQIKVWHYGRTQKWTVKQRLGAGLVGYGSDNLGAKHRLAQFCNLPAGFLIPCRSWRPKQTKPVVAEKRPLLRFAHVVRSGPGRTGVRVAHSEHANMAMIVIFGNLNCEKFAKADCGNKFTISEVCRLPQPSELSSSTFPTFYEKLSTQVKQYHRHSQVLDFEPSGKNSFIH